MQTLSIKLPTASTKVIVVQVIALIVTNVRVLSLNLILLTLLKRMLMSIIILALIAVPYLLQTLTEIQIIFAAKSVLLLLVDNSLSSDQHLYSLMSKSNPCLNRQTRSLSFLSRFYPSTSADSRKSTSRATGKSTIESTYSIFLSTKTGDSLSTYVSGILLLTQKCVYKRRMPLASLLSLTPNIRILYQTIFALPLMPPITPRYAAFLTRLLAQHYYFEVPLYTTLV